ncbi:tetratricopeptide repeat protein [Archangium lansingense]|uniref:Tetratricopeptide repeat protein n=1 Tax=Archangium lansingense TaxID=2995310 RepID=A0ABT3ZY60_9BACT|nr:tetratricopeptide repeat protein [Archangium lansinium]MCY1074339.1 tetratricopeptide repeat protein [Archangium lansinium]
MNPLEKLLAAGQLPQAHAEAKKVLARQPTNRDALVVMAKLALMDGKLPQAEEFVTKAEAQGATGDTLLVRANVAAQKGELEPALKLYQQALGKDPKRAEAHFGRGLMLIKLGKTEQSLEALAQAVQLAPTNAAFRYRLGQVQLEAGKDEEGIASLQQAITDMPRFVPAYLSLTHALASRDDLLGAKRVLEKGLKELPRNSRLLASLTVLSMALRDVNASYKAASALAANRPKDPDAQANLAQLMLARGQYQQVLHLCRTMDSLGLSNESLKMAEATCYESEEPPAYDKAVAAYEAGMGLAPDGWRAANNLGQLLLRMPAEPAEQHLPRAITVLEEAVRRAPQRPEPLLNLALALSRAGQQAKAREQVKKVLALPLPETDEVRQEAARLEQALAKA